MTDVFGSEDISDGSFNLMKKRNIGPIEIKYSWKKLKNAPFVLVLAMKSLHGNIRVSLLMGNIASELSLKGQLLCHRGELKVCYATTVFLCKIVAGSTFI